MIRRLTFAQPEVISGRAVRRCGFERRSSLPISAACLVANGIREALAMALSKEVRVRLIEPACPEHHVWRLIKEDAHVYAVHGTLNTAAFVLRAPDAITLARMIFGESSPAGATLSPVEERVVARLIASLTETLTPLCGKTIRSYRGDPALDVRTFVEIVVEEPAQMQLGIALQHDAVVEAAPLVRPEHLLDLKLSLSAEVAGCPIDASRILRLQPGAVILFGPPKEGLDRLKCSGHVVALGTCGVRGDRRAFSVAQRASAA
ncbi:MAG: FliM/FliN family flagellar motor switch protein [Candidatus Eremiobacteraeota bacterium]|nr:FliM/FliN family flagellar motor switch protein [Candidatus Eremiobacteraeota bacterium]